MGIINVVDSLCRAAELRTVWSGTARQAASGRSTEICLARGNLALCLDALTAPLGVIWELRENEIRLSIAREVSEGTLAICRRQAARRALEHAVQEYPEFALGPQALVALGNMALQDGQMDAAEANYRRMLEKYPRSPICADAWFNLAKRNLLQDRPDAALDTFWNVVDSSAPPVTAAAAYLYIGRLLLDAEQPRRAVTPLTRATQWTTDGTVRTKAVLCLAAAHLLQDRPELANEVLMDFRSDVRSEATQAAFLSALARFRAAKSPTLRLEEAQSLLSASEPLQSSDFFGRYGWYLRGRAYEELLLPELAVAVYREALDHNAHPPYRHDIRFGLGTCLADIGELDAARLQFTGLIENADPDWQRKAAFRLCRLQLDSREPLAASRIARTLLAQCTDPEEQARALQLLGAAYQRMGDHAAAALCFAGTVPGSSPSGTNEEH
ncbi:MAG: tetratricopeptide repeat protein [Planctomycetaceae bacterium]|nr:tetratricopeptide repeat protein [Planctomycetaceae bacterium]